MIRSGIFVALLAVANALAAHPRDTGRVAQSADRIRELFAKTDARGAAVLLDVETGRIVAAVGVGREANAPVLPLSVIKLYLAAIWWETGLGDGDFVDPKHGRVSLQDVLTDGWDAPGAEAAVRLRRKIGPERFLAALRAKGLGSSPGTLTLSADSDDAAWGNCLSLGEQSVTVTLEQVAQFLGAVGKRTDDTGSRLRTAMLEAVTRGSAAGVAPRLAGIDWQLGGKTGTGPAEAKPNFDGWFAGLIFERKRPRYAICVFVEGKGRGGGVAAGIAADLTRWFARAD
jgi:membrane peptidoglycan carboxypeptidase